MKFGIDKKKLTPALIVGSLRDRELVCSAIDQQASISNPVSGGR